MWLTQTAVWGAASQRFSLMVSPLGPLVRGNYNNNWNRNDRRNVNANYGADNAFGMTFRACTPGISWLVERMKRYGNLYPRICSYENLELAFRNARKGKAKKDYVIEFEANLEENLRRLKEELENLAYSPAPMDTFIICDPKTRRISASHFRDRVVHHALINVIGPIFESSFIHDSFANQKGKGTHSAILRFEKFMRKVSPSWKPRTGNRKQKTVRPPQRGNRNAVVGYALKADIRHYFDTVDQGILLQIIQRRIKDRHVLWLIGKILENHKCAVAGKGMALGNLTSQYFANVYLNELDYFVKHDLKAECYIRYVDDFVILHRNREVLETWGQEIDRFLKENLKIELHPEKTAVVPLWNGITLLGFRVFRHCRLLKKSNARRIWGRLERFKEKCDAGEMSRKDVVRSLNGWLAYAKFANSYNLRKKVAARFNRLFG